MPGAHLKCQMRRSSEARARGDGVQRQRCRCRRGDRRRCGAATALRGKPVTVRPEGRALRSRRSVEGKQASTMATVRVPVEAGLRGCNPAWKEARMGESMGHSASLADGSYAAMQGRMHTPGHPGHGPGFGPIFFHFAVGSTSGLGSIAEEGLGSIAEEE